MKNVLSLVFLVLVQMQILIAQNALDFNDGAFVDCGNNASIQIVGNTITLEAWIYPNSWQNLVYQGCIINKEQNVPDNGYMLRCGENGKVNFNLGNGSWHELSTPENTLILNQWQHIAATYDGTYQKIYVNGILIPSKEGVFSISNSSRNLFIGSSQNYQDRFFDGRIDEVRIWNCVRSQSKIQRTMNNELFGQESGLIAYYNFNQGTPAGNNTGLTTLYDQTANGNNGTLNNFLLTGASSNWVSGMLVAPPQPIPISLWAVVGSLLLISLFTVYRIRKTIAGQ